MEIKKINPNQVFKLLFPNALEQTLEEEEFEKELRESIQKYIDQPDLEEEITKTLTNDNKVRFEAFKNWFKKQGIKKPKTGNNLETKTLHGYLDLVCLWRYKGWNFKFRNVDNKLDILKDVVEMKMCQKIFCDLYEKYIECGLVIFDKKTTKMFTFSRTELGWIEEKALEPMIENAINLLEEKQNLKLNQINQDSLIEWKIIEDCEKKHSLENGYFTYEELEEMFWSGELEDEQPHSEAYFDINDYDLKMVSCCNKWKEE